MGSGESLHATVMSRDIHLPVGHQLSAPLYPLDTICLEQRSNTASQITHDSVLAGNHGGHIQCNAVNNNAMSRHTPLQSVIPF